ncbi:hypothetical protein NQ314_006445 [Rhamnusium bicolor]|uniref:PiggyBac transposable element-derived protein domain-containing protein n=1 Tax=Rhamnusium bicolor TaxID=1586634 RepID=A0AAV8Z4X3_9CUCU|nr:hypothetical protein NQ314_006445 [Rhamnusium bicolor]
MSYLRNIEQWLAVKKDDELEYVLMRVFLQEALKMVYADDDLVIDVIYMEPPEVSASTDEDSGDEEDDGDQDRLSGRLLRASVEIQRRNNDRINMKHDCTPVGIFEKFWNDDVIKHILDETKKYTLFKNVPVPNITYEEIKCALVILILSGYDTKPSRKHYWDSKKDMSNEMVKKFYVKE